MIGIGIVTGTIGYGLVVYGARLWGGDPQSLAYLFGFSSTNSAAKPGTAKPTQAQAINNINTVLGKGSQVGGGHGVR
jgi:hypothetical protein